MEPEHIKGQHPKQNSGSNLDGSLFSSLSSSSLESDIGANARLHNSSATGDTPQSSATKIEMNNSSPELSPMNSPPIQTMGQPADYNPNRIPSSAFSTKTENAAEWSMTSNVSLFSIQMGNNSFSQDYAILFGGDLFRSGELSHPFGVSEELPLPRLDDWDSNHHPSLDQTRSHGTGSLPPPMKLPPWQKDSVKLSGVENKDDTENPEVETPAAAVAAMESDVTAAKEEPVADGVVNNLKVAAVKNETTEAAPPPSGPLSFPSPLRCSNESGKSSTSFAFRV